MDDRGLDDVEIGRRVWRGERWTAQVRFSAGLDRPGPSLVRHDRLPLRSSAVVRWHEEGAGHDERSDRFRRSPTSSRVERYAKYKQATA